MTIQESHQKRWVLPPVNLNLQTKIANSLRISPILSQVLVNRSITDVESARMFLQSKLSLLSDPMLLSDMEKSSKRIFEAITNGEKITVYGDYDVDGISATALMVQCLEIISRLYGNSKSEISYYIPERLEEGYGLNVGAIEMLAGTGTNVIITVDCGIDSFDEAKIARKNGIDLIITDHHEPLINSKFESDRNDAFGLINPKLATSSYPFRELSGVGVAFMLAWALGQGACLPVRDRTQTGLHAAHRQARNKKVVRDDHVGSSQTRSRRVASEFKDFLMNALELVALGTISDVVPLRQDNRILTKYGLSSLQYSKHPGIKALKEVVGLKDKKINSYHVGFYLGPRINAAGRVGDARMGVEMLTVKTETRAKEIAEYLDNENKKRQKVQKDILESARKKILDSIDLGSEAAIIISDDDWHPGVIGVVASRLAEEFFKPVIIIATDDELGHGSARSIPNFNIYNALTECQKCLPNKNILISFGGHAQAAGLRILKKGISEFKKIFSRITSGLLTKEVQVPVLNIDAEIKLSSISKSLSKELSHLMPHGEGNPIPVFAARDISVVGQVNRFGVNGKHLNFYVRQGKKTFKAVAFGMGDKIELLKKNNGNYSIAFVLRHPFLKEKNNLSDYNDVTYKENIELEIKDIS